MEIKGLQKVTLIDYPGKIASTIFLFGCNFRCGFCHNPELVIEGKKESLQKKEILEFLEKRKRYIEGICISGGEPLMTLEKDFIKKIKEKGYSIKLDTNGSFPEKLKELLDEKLIDFVAMDIKSSKEKYHSITKTEVDMNKIEKSIKLISELEDYEFRTTILERLHKKEDIKKIADWLNCIVGKKPKKIVLQGFKNNKKFVDESFGCEDETSENYLKELKETIKNYFEDVEIRV